MSNTTKNDMFDNLTGNDLVEKMNTIDDLETLLNLGKNHYRAAVRKLANTRAFQLTNPENEQ